MGSSAVVAYPDTVVDEVSIGAFRHSRGYPNSRPLHSDADIHIDLIANSQPNSGQWEGWAMRYLLRALFVLLLFLPALVFGQAFNFPDSPIVNQQATGPNGAIYQWDGTKWIAVGGGGGGGGFTAGGDLSGTATSQSVIGIRSTSVPTLGSGYLHYTGSAFAWDTPAGGGGVSSFNTRTGAVTLTLPDVTGVGGAPAASPTFTGTVTMPDASTITSAGLNNSAGIGVGQAAAAAGIGITSSANTYTGRLLVTNTNSGNAAQASVAFLNNLSNAGALGMVSSGNTAMTNVPGDSFYLYSSGANGMTYFNTPASGTAPIRFYVNSTTLAGAFSTGNGPGGLTLGSPTGGDKGLGTLNVSSGLYINGVAAGGGSVTSVALSGGTTGLTVSGSPITTSGTITLAGTLAIANGGRGSTTAPSVGQIDVASSTTAFTPVTMSQDCTITSAGVITCLKTNNVAFTGLATAATPLSVANGGRGNSTAPSAGQILVAASATSIPPVTMSGDATITSAGAVTVGGIKGVTVPTPASGYLQYTGSAYAWSTPGAGSYAPLTNPTNGQNNYAPLATPTFTGTVTLPDGTTSTSGLGGLIVKNDANYPALFIGGTTTTPWGSLQMFGSATIMMQAGQHMNSSGTWIADATSSAMFQINSNGLWLDYPSGSTVGSAITHHYVMEWTAATNSLQFPFILSGTAGTGGGTGGGAACITSGQVLVSNSANCITSSLALKTDIRPLDGALATIEKLAPAAIYYRYKQGFGGDRSEQPGFGAETVAKIDPRYALYQNGKPTGVRYEQMAATEAAAIAEQQKEIEELRAEVKQLRGR